MSALPSVPVARSRLQWPVLAAGLMACTLLSAAIPAADSRLAQGEIDRPLSVPDVARYRQIFELQQAGQWEGAVQLVGELENEILIGHVLAQRYLHPRKYRSSYRELADWLEQFADQPAAEKIYRLAMKRKPRGAARPQKPVEAAEIRPAGGLAGIDEGYQSTKRRTHAQKRKVRGLKMRIRWNVDHFFLSKTARLLRRPRLVELFDEYELAVGYTQLAAGWLYYGRVERALGIVDPIAERWGSEIPQAQWTAGLASWRLGRFDKAASHFELLAKSDQASGWNKAAGAYWAARSHNALSDRREGKRWLKVAAEHSRTFYGFLARERLGLAPDVGFETLLLTRQGIDRLLRTEQGARAVALVQIGQESRAEQELITLADWNEPETGQAMLALAHSAGHVRLGFGLARRLVNQRTSDWPVQALDTVLYPVPPWRPDDGFKLDRALIFAFMRQESSFNPRAKSHDGARGLMQLLPSTASSIDRLHNFRGKQRALLYDPGLNMALGQRYLRQLLRSRRVKEDLLRLATGYNAGPGNLRKWERRINHEGDPLLFLEMLPTLETRLFVERVLTNLWVYRQRFGQDAPSLRALASDQWPPYTPLDNVTAVVAAAR